MQVRVFLSVASQPKGAAELCPLWCLSHNYPFIHETFVSTSVDLHDEQLVGFYSKGLVHLEGSLSPDMTRRYLTDRVFQEGWCWEAVIKHVLRPDPLTGWSICPILAVPDSHCDVIASHGCLQNAEGFLTVSLGRLLKAARRVRSALQKVLGCFTVKNPQLKYSIVNSWKNRKWFCLFCMEKQLGLSICQLWNLLPTEECNYEELWAPVVSWFCVGRIKQPSVSHNKWWTMQVGSVVTKMLWLSTVKLQCKYHFL